MIECEKKMKQCKQCNKTDYESRFNRTTDNEDICIKCLTECQDHYKKGLISFEEVRDFYQLKKEYKALVDKMLLKIKKYAKYYNESPVEILKEVRELEDSLSITAFKKGRGFHKAVIDLKTEKFEGGTVTTLEEHYIIVKQVMDNFDLIRESIPEELVKTTDRDINGNYRSFADKHYKWRLLV